MSIDQWLGLITGLFFGLLLQKGRVLRFEKQVGALLLKDMTASHKSMNLGAVLLGGALYGVGWAVMGFCPGTSIGALGEGRWHALFAIAGMVAGAALYAELYPFFQATVMTWKEFGKIGLPEALGVSPWLIIPLFWAATISLFFWFERKGL
jgi:uncharacterized membrane protein YedE/YeeE